MGKLKQYYTTEAEKKLDNLADKFYSHFVEKDFDMPGFVQNPYAFMRRASLFVLSSNYEGFGIPILEAQLMGIPVITNKFGAMGDYTYYGISVPFLQKSYEHIGRGIWTTPDIKGISNALENIHNNNLIITQLFLENLIYYLNFGLLDLLHPLLNYQLLKVLQFYF